MEGTEPPRKEIQICVVGSLCSNNLILNTAKNFGVPVLKSTTGLEFLEEKGKFVVFIVEDDSGSITEVPHQPNFRIIGPTALLELAEKKQDLSAHTRPIFSHAFYGSYICFTGFRKRPQLMRLVRLVQNMGGKIQKEISKRVTHLIANSCEGEKYRYASTFRIPILSEEWIHTAWERRTEVNFNACATEFVETHKLKCFRDVRVCFVGFSESEKNDMAAALANNGGIESDIADCTHIVVESYDAYIQETKINPNESREPPALCVKRSLSLIREEDGSISPVDSKNVSFFPSSCTTSPPYETPKLTNFPKLNSFCTSTPRASSSCDDTSEEMVTAECCESCDICDKQDVEDNPQFLPSQMYSESSSISGPSEVPDKLDSVVGVRDLSAYASVIDERPERPQNVPPNAYIVKASWLWKSVQDEARADESEHLVEPGEDCIVSPSGVRQPVSTPRRKRKPSFRLLQSPAGHKRRSSVSDAGLLSVSGSFLDCSAASEKATTDEVECAVPKTHNPRHQVFLELLQTEKNYVGILHTIMTSIKAELEAMPEEEALLDHTEFKTIFGNLPPIYELHSKMLEDLCWASDNWNDNVSIGKIVLRYIPDMMKSYPPFVNFFEQTKDMLNKCDKEKPRFHAFLKVCQIKPECGRQTLCELFIRPVQRLPSISLLLGDLVKHTSKSNPDHDALESALAAIREVMTYINEDKRRMEACMDIFTIFNDIDNCPPHLVSSHRAFVTRCEVEELSNELCGRGDGLVLFLFSDVLEVCKKRSKSVGSARSPTNTSFRSTKHFKHVRLIPLSDIKKVFNVQDKLGDEERQQHIFALKCRSNHELREKLYSFTMTDEDNDKGSFLQTLCRQLANTVCKADPGYFLSLMEYSELDLNSSDAGFGTLSKAFRRTKTKIGRTFSFNKTPNKLKRAVSSMMSPFGSTTNLTPSTQLAQMRLASCTNINEIASPSDAEALKPPLSLQPRRKSTKASSLSGASFRRL